ncbi:MAG: sodium:calcium exchanger [Synechococcaceae cyanobacterium SM2_3_1]|nr:sodium:calcium exchanger [Synechococcaceae cyanobacterium SM2_3_1]
MALAELSLILDMVSILGAAAVGGYLAHCLRQPVLLGYLIGGIVVGPAGLGWVNQEGDIQTLAEVGVALLLFALGIEFSLTDLLKVRRIALGGGSLQVLLTMSLTAGLALGIGLVETIPQAIFLGAVLSLSSTAVVLKSLIERNEVQTSHGQAMLAILITQDLSLGIMLAVLPALDQPPESVGLAVLVALVKAISFLLGALVAGRWLVPRLMRGIAQTGSQELFVLSVFALCLGVALFTAAIGLGIAMGAFVAGLMISQVEYADHALDSVLPMRDIFATLFFASIGTLIDPGFLMANTPILLGLVAVVMLGKALIVTPVVAGLGYPLKTALTVGLGINQIGEFSFVLASVAKELDLFSPRLYGLTVGTTAITLLITPFLLRATPLVADQLDSWPWLERLQQQRTVPSVGVEPGLKDHIVVAGYGRVGQTLVRLLRSQGYTVLVIDNNEATLQSLRQEDIPYLYGDASSDRVLGKAGLEEALALAIALPDPLATRLTLKRALSRAPDLEITVRAHSNREIDSLYQLGAREVVQPEFEASLEMGSHTLLSLGHSSSLVQGAVNECRKSRYRSLLSDRRLATIPPDDLTLAMEGLQGKWYELKAQSPLVGKTLASANIRQHTGATIMQIRRPGQTLTYPEPQVTLESGDKLLVVGDVRERACFEDLILGRLS